jgi:hypothetical protein
MKKLDTWEEKKEMKNSFLKRWFKTQRGLHLKEHPQWSTCYTVPSDLHYKSVLVPLNILNCFPTETKLESTRQFWATSSKLEPQIHGTQFAQSSTLMDINWKVWLYGSTFVFTLWLNVQRGASMKECPMFQKTWWWVDQYGSFGTKEKVMSVPMNLNMNRLLSPTSSRSLKTSSSFGN